MVNEPIKKLISISSASRGRKLDCKLNQAFPFANITLLTELNNILIEKNGFYAFESALNFYSNDDNDLIPSLPKWNDKKGWKSCYDSVDKIVFFAEDLFGDQFGISKDLIIRLKLESGKIIGHSTSINEWARKLLNDYDYELGWSLAHEWQLRNGPLRNGYRLLPRKPFVLGGEYEINNLIAIKKKPAMQAYKNLYLQIKNIPDGEATKISGWLN